jgi:hypothetical protein
MSQKRGKVITTSPSGTNCSTSSFVFHRVLYTNTSARSLGNIVERLTTLVERHGEITLEKHNTSEKWMTAAGQLMREPVASDVINKLCFVGEHLGLFERVKPSKPADTWLKVYPAAKALLEDSDFTGMLAYLLVQAPYRDGSPTRDVVGTMQFLAACEDAGVSSVRLDHLSYFRAPHNREGGWKKEVARLKKHTTDDLDAAITLDQWLAYADSSGGARQRIKDAVDALAARNPTSEEEVLQFALEDKANLLPNARDVGRITKSIAEQVLNGDLEDAKKNLIKAILDGKSYNHMDSVDTHLRYMLDTELIVLENPKNKDQGSRRLSLCSRRFSLSEFGREVLGSIDPNPSSYKEAKRRQRSSAETPFQERGKRRSQRFAEFLANDLTEAGRVALCKDLDWEEHRGRNEPERFEWAVMRAIFALTSGHSDHDHLSGVRTKVSHDFKARVHAPGGGADGWVRVESGKYILVEATGEGGVNLVSHELEPVVRHLYTFMKDHGRDVVSLLVAPHYENRMVSHLILDAKGGLDLPPAYVIPVTTEQLQRLVMRGSQIDNLVSDATNLLREAAVSPSLEAADKFIKDLEELVSSHTEAE